MDARLLFAASLVLCAACQVQGSVKGSANANESRSEQNETTTVAPAPAPAPAPAAPVAPPADACPLTCFEARGSERASMTTEEQTQLRSALEPVLGRMRSCTSGGDFRRHGSPVINLRIAPDGTLSDLGVDPHHGRDFGCLDESARGANVSVSLPGRKVVRCAERCVQTRETRETPPRRGNRRR
jgi:hypothetical protein